MVAFIAGVAIVQAVVRSAIHTVVIPQGERSRLGRIVFRALRPLYEWRARRARSFEDGQRLLARFAPMSLVALAASWAVLVIVGYVPMFWAVGEHSLVESVQISGSSLTTLGFVAADGLPETLLAVSEALLGLGLVALLISFLPTLYQLFSRREAQVVKLEVRAGSPPTAREMLLRYHRIGWDRTLDATWAEWEQWFVELEESHSTHPSLVFFRSQRPSSNWVTSCGAVLDAAAVSLAALQSDAGPQASVTIRSGFLALRAIAGFYGIPFDPEPRPDDPISIRREEFDALCDELRDDGLAVRDDREAAWRAFAGWRVNYDAPLLGLCALVDAPPTPWSSDRMHRYRRPRGLGRWRWQVEALDAPRSW